MIKKGQIRSYLFGLNEGFNLIQISVIKFDYFQNLNFMIKCIYFSHQRDIEHGQNIV